MRVRAFSACKCAVFRTCFQRVITDAGVRQGEGEEVVLSREEVEDPCNAEKQQKVHINDTEVVQVRCLLTAHS